MIGQKQCASGCVLAGGQNQEDISDNAGHCCFLVTNSGALPQVLACVLSTAQQIKSVAC